MGTWTIHLAFTFEYLGIRSWYKHACTLTLERVEQNCSGKGRVIAIIHRRKNRLLHITGDATLMGKKSRDEVKCGEGTIHHLGR